MNELYRSMKSLQWRDNRLPAARYVIGIVTGSTAAAGQTEAGGGRLMTDDMSAPDNELSPIIEKNETDCQHDQYILIGGDTFKQPKRVVTIRHIFKCAKCGYKWAISANYAITTIKNESRFKGTFT